MERSTEFLFDDLISAIATEDLVALAAAGMIAAKEETPTINQDCRGFIFGCGDRILTSPSGYQPDELPGCSTPRCTVAPPSKNRNRN